MVKALKKFEVESNFKLLIYSLLCDRTVVAEWGSAQTSRKVNRGTSQGGLVVNDPSKTKMVLFTRSYRVPNVPLPTFVDSRLQPIGKVKYLRLILDRKLSLKPNIEERVRKASLAL